MLFPEAKNNKREPVNLGTLQKHNTSGSGRVHIWTREGDPPRCRDTEKGVAHRGHNDGPETERTVGQTQKRPTAIS